MVENGLSNVGSSAVAERERTLEDLGSMPGVEQRLACHEAIPMRATPVSEASRIESATRHSPHRGEYA
jgi:hypothetical protein